MISSARNNIDCGTERPSFLAVLAFSAISVRKRSNCRGSAKVRDVPNRVTCQRRKQEKI